MTVQEALAFLISNLANAVGPILGFLSALLLFEVQEWRKKRVAVELTRQSLISELNWLESVLSMTVVKCANQSGILNDGVKEFRWSLKESFDRHVLEEMPAEQRQSREKMLALSDEELVPYIKLFHQENAAVALPITVISSVLAAPISGNLSSAEITKLIDIQWQSTMLARQAENMNECLRLSFTVTEEPNHDIIKQNHLSALRWYGLRARYMLAYVRTAMNEIRN